MLGFGNAWRGDEGAGLAVAERLRARGEAGALALGEPAPELFERWSSADEVVLVDAAAGSGAPPGTIHRLDALAGPLPAGLLRLSTHGDGLAAAVELARALDRLPARLVVHAIAGDRFAPGEGLSPAVARAVETLVEELATCTSPG